ncbi:hypothetical protein IMZ48_30030 [Candidatus Bathyarchaeota archaeon]|nr:hypothetical protein [Candidatus Bathyarchaeota archaeon]
MDRSAFQEESKVREGEFPELEETPLPAPALNISAFYVRDNNRLYGNNWTDTRGQQQPFQDEDQQRYVYSNKPYSTDDIEKDGRCQPLSTDVGVPLPLS